MMKEKIPPPKDLVEILTTFDIQEVLHSPYVLGKVETKLFVEKTGEIVEVRKYENLIVNSFAVLLAQLSKNTGVPGVTHLALGSGDPLWTPTAPPDPDRTITQLESEVFRKAVQSSGYELPNGDPSGSPTNRIFLVFVFTGNEANVGIMEMALFGGLGASVPGGGDMVNVYRLPVLNKSLGFGLQITWRLIFG